MIFKKKNKKIFILLSVVLSIIFFLANRNVFAFDGYSQSRKTDSKFYILRIIYNSKSNSIRLDNNDGRRNVLLDNYNLTNDTGSGSQFYAKVLNIDNKYEIFFSRQDRFYLGQWHQLRLFIDRLFEDGKRVGENQKQEEGEIQISVPYFYDGKTIEIYDAKSNKLALTVDISRFAHVSPDKLAKLHPEIKKTVTAQPAERDKNYQKWFWLLAIIPVILISAGMYWFFQKRKARIENISNDSNILQ